MNNVNYINPKSGNILTENSEGLWDNEHLFKKENGVYKFVESEGYTSNFGFQWKKFKKTQLDKFNGLSYSKDRFFVASGWTKMELDNKNVLEVGCGAGRFTQILLDYTNANVYSLDYSESVEANFENNGSNERLKLFQASVYEMPFKDETFDFVFCFGVLQHTPDVQKTIFNLQRVLKKGGSLVVDFYPYKGFYTLINAKYIFRRFTKNMDAKRLLRLITKNVGWMISLSKFFSKIKLGFFNRFIPICDITGTLPDNLSKDELKEWVILDTFDMFSPQFDQPQKISNVKEYFENNGLKVQYAGFKTYSNNKSVALVRGIK